MAPGKDLGVVEDTRAEAARDRVNITLPRFSCRETLGDKSDHEYGEAERKVKVYVRTCDICQRGNADTHLPRGKIGHLEIPVMKW